ncbi:sigma factor [Streptomyces sp. NPDC047434]|uniref:sigma factor n=1 Tax=Streptomyces sp. NPDC047434 TaxID=3155143 RepID=UPI0033E8275C
MDAHTLPAELFERHRPRLRALAYRLLGSFDEADDALQETRLRLSRSETEATEATEATEPPDARPTAVVARVCLDLLRARETPRAGPWDAGDDAAPHPPDAAGDPDERALLADSAERALLVVLDTVTPAERLAFVLHDLFSVPFEEIAPIVERTPAAARQLAVRVRRRVQGTEEMPEPDLPRQREVVTAFLAAARSGDVDVLRALLDPDVVLRADAEAVRTGATGAHGADDVAKTFSGRVARAARIATVDGAAGLVWAPGGETRVVFGFTVLDDRITSIDVLADPGRLHRLELELLDE